MSASSPQWEPSAERIARAKLTAFSRVAERRFERKFPDYASLYRFSIDRPADFWRAVWDFTRIRGSMGERVIEHPERMPGAEFFPEARLNFAENLLRRRDGTPAIVFNGEGQVQRSLTFAELFAQSCGVAVALRDAGIQPGDRVAAFIPNIPEAIVAALGAAAVGAVWSSCSPDFGVQGVIDRFGQIEPKILLSADGYFYAGRAHDSLEKLADIQQLLPTVKKTVVIPYVTTEPDLSSIAGATLWQSFLGEADVSGFEFERFPFNHPLYILYSSGTTGVPKCIVHGAGGTLIQHLKEHQLQCDIDEGDRVFYFTTCGWMMWNWLVTVLASEATILLYDGSPFHPGPQALFDFADASGMTLFGTSARFIDAITKAGFAPRESHRLESVRTMTSTGSPLVPESFDYVYAKVKKDIHLASISGGTDIISCFVGGNPVGPVWRGEIQAAALGMAVDVFDESGRSLAPGEKGELVCTQPFPSMPVSFWNDPDGRKYRAAYFERYPGVWHHGDFIARTEHNGFIIYGRSDAVLNPGGVRIGTAEIYRQVEQLDEVLESLVIAQQWQNDERIVLFVRLRDGLELSDALRDRIRQHIRSATSPRHVPARIVAVPEIPRTKSGKIVELAVREVVHGRQVKNREALANPEALEHFRDRPELRT
ncbi:MAG: acetoacetate--CoA ligase [Vicinamibacterales bacterium]